MGYRNKADQIAHSKKQYQAHKAEIAIANKANPKHLENAKKWNAANPERRREIHRKAVCQHHGITVEKYEKQFLLQNGVCAICLQPELSGLALAIDHDHSHCPGPYGCKECFRGLLCSRCNPGLGYFKDDRWRLAKAIEYITKGSNNVDL